ncbi:MAG: response regulator [Deltaproteobacteria bacterium]|nr:MAG: response regulator [Deltaproteobacteria bacterium]
MLDLTRVTRGELSMKPEILDVHAVLQEVVELCGNGRPAGVRVTAALAAPAHHVRADPARLLQVFWNLLRNAFQSTPTDGEVTLRSSNDDAGRVRVVVEDTGGGIEAGDLERIFRPFYQGRAAGDRSGHLGLGLAIAKSVIEAHGGRITAASEGKGSGARFTVELPTVAVEEARPPAPEAGSLASSGVSILLIEDHPDTALAVSEALRLEGYDVSVAGSVAAALERALEPYDVVISDLRLPDGNGIDLLRQLRSARPVKAIALSGFGSEKDVRACKEAGFDEHLTKPVALETLTRTIESLMAHAEAATKRLVTPRRG